jgi:hypothetical protein
MAEDLPIVCSLEAGDLQQRLIEVAEVGAEALLDHRAQNGRYVLRFRSTAKTRLRLRDIVAAEAHCCAFLDLSLRDDGDELVLSIGAPQSGQDTADALAAAFGVNTAASLYRPGGTH